MEGIPDRRGGRLFTERSHTRSRRLRWTHGSRKRTAGPGEATGMSEVRWNQESPEEYAARPTRSHPPKRIGRREPPGPPVSVIHGASLGEGARRKLRRDTGNECGASARSRSSGKQKSVERIGLVLRVLSKGRPQEGESARRKLPEPLTRRAGAHLQTGWAARGGGAAHRKARGLSPQRDWSKGQPPSETVRRRHART